MKCRRPKRWKSAILKSYSLNPSRGKWDFFEVVVDPNGGQEMGEEKKEKEQEGEKEEAQEKGREC